MNNLSKYRKEAGLSQSELSEKCGWGTAQARVGHYETGRREPSLEDLRTIISVFSEQGVKCSIDCIFPNPTAAQA